MIVDDDDAIRTLLARVLARDGYTIVVARHGGEAISYFADASFDAILLDLMMPIANGLDVMAFVRARAVRTRIIVVTAAHGKQITGIRADDVFAVLHKPFDLEELRNIVVRCVTDSKA